MNKSHILPVATALVLAAGCSTAPEPDQAGLEYDSGPISSTNFSNCIKAGTREYTGPGDKTFVYPAGQRTYEFSTRDTKDTTPFDVVTKDELPLTIEGIVTFSLNTDCKVLQKFHERIGLKYAAAIEDSDTDGKDDDGGWNRMLGAYLRQPLDQAMDVEAKAYPWKDLYTDPTIKQQWANKVGQRVVQQVNSQAGGQYFCTPNFAAGGQCGSFSLTLQQPKPPPTVLAGMARAQAAVEDARAQTEENKKIDIEKKGIEALVKALGGDAKAAVMWKAIQDGRVKIVPIPAGGAINVSGN